MPKEVMKKSIAKRASSDIAVPYSPDQIIAGRAQIETILNKRLAEVKDITNDYRSARIERDEWNFRWETVSGLLKKQPANETLQTLEEQAKIHVDLSRKKVEAFQIEMQEIEKVKAATKEALKKLQRMELIYSTGVHVNAVHNELNEIVVRTRQLEGSDTGVDREAKRMEYYVEAMLELTMERMK